MACLVCLLSSVKLHIPYIDLLYKTTLTGGGSTYILHMVWKVLTVWGLLILFNYVDKQNHF